MEIADSRLGAGGQKSELTRSLLTSGIGRYQMNLELPRLRWGGEEKVKMAPPCEDSPGMGFLFVTTIESGARSWRTRVTG